MSSNFACTDGCTPRRGSKCAGDPARGTSCPQLGATVPCRGWVGWMSLSACKVKVVGSLQAGGGVGGPHVYRPMRNQEGGPRRGGVPRQILCDGGAARGKWCRCLLGQRRGFPGREGSDQASPTTGTATGRGAPTATGLGFPVYHGRVRCAQVRALRLEKKN